MMSRSSPLISIVTPSRNQGQFLEQTIRSVLEQDYDRVEYIIVDGGSTDGSLDIIRKYAGQLAYWVSEADQGQSDAINKGFQHATGDLVAWLNSDDLLMPHSLRQVAESYVQSDGAALCHGDACYIDDYGQVTSQLRRGPADLYSLLFFRPLPQPSVFIDRQCLDSVGLLDKALYYCMEFDLWLRLSARYPLQHVPGALAGLRSWKGQKTQDGRIAALYDEELDVLQRFIHLNASLDTVKSWGKTALAVHCFRAALCALAGGDIEGAKSFCRRVGDDECNVRDAPFDSLWLGLHFSGLIYPSMSPFTADQCLDQFQALADSYQLAGFSNVIGKFRRRLRIIKASQSRRKEDTALAQTSLIPLLLQDTRWIVSRARLPRALAAIPWRRRSIVRST